MSESLRGVRILPECAGVLPMWGKRVEVCLGTSQGRAGEKMTERENDGGEKHQLLLADREKDVT